MTDSRKDERLPVALVMRYREPTMLEAREGQCQNVSSSGMCVLTPRPSPRGALIRFECVSGGAAAAIRGTGRVVWQRSKGDARGPAGMGVRFVRLEPGCVEALETLLEQLGGGRRPTASTSGAPPARDTTPEQATVRRDAISDRPAQAAEVGVGAASLGSSPGSATGITQQGMGAVRSRAGHQPTLRGIPTSSSPPANGSSSTPPARETAPDGIETAPTMRSPVPVNLGKTLPGHATVVGVPFPPSQSAPPPEPDKDQRSTQPTGARATSGTLRERLDRTRRGMASPPPEPPPDEVSGVSRVEDGKRSASSDRPDATPTGQRHDAAGDPTEGSEEAPDPRPPRVTAEPVDVDSAAARRRALRAAEISSVVPALPDPDGSSKRNWVPWIVVGGGLLVSGLLVKMFGSVPAGPTITDTDEVSVAGEQSTAGRGTPQADPLRPASSLPAEVVSEGSVAAASGTLTGASHVLEIVSDPPGARVTAAGRWVLAPGSLQLPAPTAPIEVRAEFSGRRTTSVTVAPSEFVRKGDRWVHRVVVKLPLESVTAAPSQAPSAQVTATSAAASSKETAKQAAASPRAKPAAAQTAAPPPPAPPEPLPEPTPAAAPLIQIAPPPVPIESAPGAESPPAPAATAEPETPEPRSAKPASQGGLAQARECLSRGDNECVVKALEGRARSERELGILIETYLVLGNASDAERAIRRYLNAYPDGKSARKFERWLERRTESSSTAGP